MIPRLKRREQLELNQNTEPNLNLTPQISFSGVEGKLDLLWLSASLASSWTGSPLSNLSHVLGVTPSWWHKQEWAQSERLCPPRWQRSELARVHRGLASLARCQKCRSSTQKKKPPNLKAFSRLRRVCKTLQGKARRKTWNESTQGMRDGGDHVLRASQPCAQEQPSQASKAFFHSRIISLAFWAPQIKKTAVTEQVRHGSQPNPNHPGAMGCQDLGQAHLYSVHRLSQLTGTKHPAVTFKTY